MRKGEPGRNKLLTPHAVCQVGSGGCIIFAGWRKNGKNSSLLNNTFSIPNIVCSFPEDYDICIINFELKW